MARDKVLFIVTSHNKLLDGTPTGWYLPEAAHPWEVLAPHVDIDWASPKGGAAPIDPDSIELFKNDDVSQRFLNDQRAKKGFENTMMIHQVVPSQYKAIFYVGGHGPMFDLARDIDNITLATNYYRAHRGVLAAVCHGPAGLIGAKNEHNKPILAGQPVTAFSNEEEATVNKTDKVPFLLEDEIKKLGGHYVKADKPFGPKVVVAQNGIITGQNPASARGVGEEILKRVAPGAICLQTGYGP